MSVTACTRGDRRSVRRGDDSRGTMDSGFEELEQFDLKSNSN
jgi:hypothetical protein